MPDGLAFAVLGSSSIGNALVVESGQTRVLVDAGFFTQTLEQRVAGLARYFQVFEAIMVTHVHLDYCRGVPRLSNRDRLPAWLTPDLQAAIRSEPVYACQLYSPHESFAIGVLEFCSYPMPHDAHEPAQSVVGDGDQEFGVLTDAGYVTLHRRNVLDNCIALLIEANHDADLLTRSPYPGQLKRQVDGHQEHLSNQQAAELPAQLNTDWLRHIVVTHTSKKITRICGTALSPMGLAVHQNGYRSPMSTKASDGAI